MRFFGGYAIGFFLPKYFNSIYPDYIKPYSYGNAAVVSLCGFASSIIGGIVSDKYEKEGILFTKMYICLGSAVTGTITFALCTLIQSNFWFSLCMLALEYFCAENWIAPVISMIMNTVHPKTKEVSSVLSFSSLLSVAQLPTHLPNGYSITLKQKLIPSVSDGSCAHLSPFLTLAVCHSS